MVQNTKITSKAISSRLTGKTQRLDSPLFGAMARELLSAGQSLRFQAQGLSMLPTIQDGDVVHVAPLSAKDLRCGDIVFVEDDHGRLRAHRLVTADRRRDRFVTQGDASLEPDAPVGAAQILGRVMAKEQTMNGTQQLVKLHGVGARTRRQMTQVRNVAAGWVKSALGMRAVGARTGAALSLLLCLAAVSASAQVAVDTSAFNGATLTQNTSVTVPFTPGGTANLLVVGVAMNIGASASTKTATVASVTYGAQALTFLNAHNDTGVTRRVEIWFLRAPVAGLHTITVTMSGFGAGNVGTFANAVTFSGADQTDPLRPFVSTDGTAAAPLHTVLDVPSAAKEVVYAVEAIGGDFDQNLPAAGFGGIVQQAAGFTGTGTGADVSGAGYTAAGTPSVPIPVVLTAARGAATTNFAVGAISVHPLNADMGVTVTTTGAIVAGGTTTYTVKLQDNGWSDAANVNLSFPLAAGETFVSATASQGSCSGTTTVTCTLGTIPSAFSATVTIKASIATAGNYTTTATVSSTTTDLYTGNNTFTTTVPVQSVVCATPGKDGVGGTLAGVVNTYYPGSANAASGAKTISVGAPIGSATAIATGDLLLVMQMQDAAINTTNGSTYGDGSGAGSGVTNLNAAGAYEYVKAASAVVAGVVTIAGAGNTGGLIYSYSNANATTTQGQRRFQVIRVPQYTSATLGATLTATPWGGITGLVFAGGVLAFDVRDTLTLNSVTVSVDGLGFRGAPGLQLVGGVFVPAATNTDFVFVSPTSPYTAGTSNGWHGGKGEGIAGTPMWVDSAGAALLSGSDYPSGGATDGSMGRGAPGNAGGGGTDAVQTATNSNNSGGSGGANGGAGGAGGNSQAVDLPSGGVPSATFPGSINRVVMGGGGGAGGRNNSVGDASAGGAGGGIVMIRAGFLSGTATITANGASADQTTANDGGGGGGAGGSIMVLSQAGGESGLTLNANGGKGGSANSATVFAAFTSGVHGPGGGGGGGLIIISGTPASTNRVGGAFGTTETEAFEWGATAGAKGPTPIGTATLAQVAGVRSGVECAASDCVIAKNHVGNFVRGTGGNNYTITVSNASPVVATSGVVTVVDTLPTGMTATAISGPGWTCILGTLTCTRADALAPLASYPPITVTVTAPAIGFINPLINTAVVSGGGELQTNNDTATDPTTIIGTNLTITKTGAPNPIKPGQTLTYTISVSNTGPNSEAMATVTDPLPTTDVTFVSAVATNGWGCSGTTTVICSKSPFAVGGTSVITITTTTKIPDTVVNTATITDTDTGLDTKSATATTITTFPTSVALRSFSAQRIGAGTVIAWQTGGERHNLGFNVYREENGARVKVNPTLIAGSALRLRQSLDQHNGTGYAWPDAKNGTAYWLEDVEINGARTMHGPVTPSVGAAGASASTPADATRSETMAELSRSSSQSLAQAGSVANADAPLFDTSHALPHFATVQAVTEQQRKTQFELAAHPAVKLALRSEGWYRVSQKELVAAGLNAGVDPKFLRLFTEGIEQPIRITGAINGFGPDAAIEFYATGIDTPFSDTRVGWLVAGDRPGLRIAEAGNAGGNAGPLSFPYAVELRQRITYFAALLNGENKDNFFGAIVNSMPVDQVLTTHDIANAASGGVKLEVVLQGATTGITHTVNVSLNGTSMGVVNFADQEQGKVLLDVAAGQLLEGDNTVTLTAQNGDNDISVVDHITLHYLHTYVAESDALRFTGAAGDHVQITGFVTKPVRLVDVTNPAHPVNLQTKVTGTAGQYALDVNVPWTTSGTHTLLSLAWSRFTRAAAVKNQPSTWHAPQAGSDIVMITHPKFASALQPLVKLRQSQGKSVAVVNVDDLYDEFNFGERSPFALRDFLASATGNWKMHPQYLLLVGDASVDPRNYLGAGYDDFVPTRIVETFYLKTASDEWFSDFKGAGIGEIATGRLPVRTESDLQIVVRKITSHDTASGTWSKQALLVADLDGGLTFSADTQAVKNLLPTYLTANVADANKIGIPATRAQLLAQITSGQLLVNYMGHGSVQVWSDGLLSDADATAFTNGNRLPVFLIMDCLNGFFQDVYTTSMAESLLLAPDGGAVAVWSSSGLNDSAPQAELDKQVVQGLFSTQNPALGDAIRAAKAKVDGLDVRRTYILFGDPSMRLQH